MIALQAVTPAALAAAVPGVTLAEARKLVAQVHRDEPIAASSSVRRSAADATLARGHVPALAIVRTETSAIDPFQKHVLRLPDGAVIETVRIPLEKPGRFTVCVSSQVGCALACAFCATGALGLSRNLETWEIVEQVRVVRRTVQRIHGVVFQGMGEPLANLDRVLEAIAVLQDPCALRIDARNITVCTAGLPHGIRRLAREAPQVRLGWSVGSAIAATRRTLMPIARAHGDDDLFDAIVEHARITGLQPMWAITLLDGVNDGDDDAAALVVRARAFRAATERWPRISLISYNPAAGDFVRSRREEAFRAVLAAAGLPSHRRYSGGGDVLAACGQLAATV